MEAIFMEAIFVEVIFMQVNFFYGGDVLWKTIGVKLRRVAKTQAINS